MQNQTFQKVVTEIKNDTPANKTSFILAVLIFAVLALAVQQKFQEQSKYEQIDANYYDLTHPPITTHDE